MRHIERTLDRLLDHCGYEPAVLLYRRLCRHYWEIDPVATAAYVEHLLRTPQAIEQMRRHSRGVTDFRLRLYWNEFKNMRIPFLQRKFNPCFAP